MTGKPPRNVTSAGAWAITGRLGAKALDFGSFVVLAKVLTPADFGLVALALTAILIVDVITEMPLTDPLLRAPDVTADHYHTSFTLGLLRALILAGAAVALGPLLASFYAEPELGRLLLVLAAGPVLRSLSSPRMADFARRYDMRPDFAVSLVAKAVSFAVVAAVAVTTRSHWAIVSGSVTTAGVGSALSYLLAPYGPRLRLNRWRDFADVVGWTSASQVFAAVNAYLDRFVLGRLVTADLLGRYSMATDLSVIPFHGGLIPFCTPLTARFARVDDRARLRELWATAVNGSLVLFGTPLVLLALLARPIVAVVLGDAWLGAWGLIAAAALSALPALVAFLLTPLAVARYRSRALFQRTVATTAVLVPLTLLGAVRFGAYGTIAANGVANVAASLVSMRAAAGLTGESTVRQLWGTRRTVIGYLALALAVWPLAARLLPPEGGAGTIPGAGSLAGAFVLGAVVAAGVGAQAASMGLVWLLEGRPPGVEATLWGVLGRQASRWRGATVPVA